MAKSTKKTTKKSNKTIYLTNDMKLAGTRGDVSGATIGQLQRALSLVRHDGAKIVVVDDKAFLEL